MDFSESYLRVRRAMTAVVFFLGAVFFFYRGQNPADGDSFHLIVPVMCIGTALAMCATGLAVMLQPAEGE